MKTINYVIYGIFAIVLMACNNPASDKNKETDGEKMTEGKNAAVVNLPLEWTVNANIYEVNIRQYSEEGTFNAFIEQLPRLKEMGVDILWIMPIYPIGQKNKKGELGSYYSISDYTGINPAFGELDDFKKLVEKAHQMGMYVILDWVANHTAWDHPWIKEHPEYYEKDADGKMISPFDWTDVVSLDYNNQEMRKAMRDAMQYWLKEANIDGFRCDVAGEVPTDFWNWLRPQLDDVKPVFMLAESEKPELLESAFDMDYGWEFHHIMNEIAQGKKNVKDILSYLKVEQERTSARAYKMYFITNHDENSWNGSIKERMGDAADAWAVYTFTMHAMPLIYSGQEAANEKRLEFFEVDPIDWKDYPKQGFYQKLIEIKHQNEALWNGANGGDFKPLKTDHPEKILAFRRLKGDNDMVVIINFSKEAFTSQLQDFQLKDFEVLIEDNISFNQDHQSFEMEPWGYAVLRKK